MPHLTPQSVYQILRIRQLIVVEVHVPLGCRDVWVPQQPAARSAAGFGGAHPPPVRNFSRMCTPLARTRCPGLTSRCFLKSSARLAKLGFPAR